jgi:hypothetical protein
MKRKERKTDRKNDITALPPPFTSAPAPYRRSPGRELPDFSSRQEIYHRLITLFHGEQLRDLHVSASACYPALGLSHRFPERALLAGNIVKATVTMFQRLRGQDLHSLETVEVAYFILGGWMQLRVGGVRSLLYYDRVVRS